MEPLGLKISGIVERCCDVKTFRLKLEKELLFEAGQYLTLTLNVDGKDMVKALSISSSPTEKGYIEFTKKLTHSDFSNALKRLSVGDEVSVRLPMGQFVIKEAYQKIAFLSGGIGITPIRSIVKCATDLKSSKDFVLLYSSRDFEHLIFKDDFDQMCLSNKNLKVFYTVTGELKGSCGLEMGCINADMIKEKISDYHQRVFYICGPPGMVDAMEHILREELGLPQEAVVKENFIGY
ncbi:MAG: FAD-dependent oxidoreductase [Candidatus Omnitrophota bacterium]